MTYLLLLFLFINFMCSFFYLFIYFQGWVYVPCIYSHARLDPINVPETFWFSYIAGSDFPHPIWLRSSKEGLDRTVYNRPISDLDGLVRYWRNASDGRKQVFVQESSGPVLGKLYQFPTFRLGCSLPQKALVIYCTKRARIRIGYGWLCQGLAKQIRSGSNRRARIIRLVEFWQTLPIRSESDAGRVRHVYWASNHTCFRSLVVCSCDVFQGPVM